MTVLIAAAEYELAQLIDLPRHICGTGSHEALINLTKNACLFTKKDIVLVGTAGCFAKENLHKIFVATSSSWLPTCERLGKSYRIKNLDPELSSIGNLNLLKKFPQKHVLCCSNVSLVADIPTKYAASDVIENLEFYAILKALSGVAETITGFFYTTNLVGPTGHEEWLANFTVAAQRSADCLKLALQP